ncbi:molybdate ABC transporter substrate-binding protein [soil metagenome]
MRSFVVSGFALVIALSLLIAPSLAGTRSQAQERVTLTVSAASDLTFAFEDLGRRFEEETGISIAFNFGSTGELTQQIIAGAPVDVFAAANIAFIDELSEEGLTLPDTEALYARGRIVIWPRSGLEIAIDDLNDLARAEVKRIAIANPDHAPYGLAAKEAMISAGIWDEIQDKLVLGENISDTFRYGETGDVDVAIVALSLAVRTDAEWVLIDEEMHEPIDQALVVIAGTDHEQEARAFADFVNSEEGRAIMRGYGFVLPGEVLDLDAIATPQAAATPVQ